MKNAWWWIVIVVIVLAVGFFFLRPQTTSNQASSTAVKQTTSMPATAAVETAPTPAAGIAARNNSDASLNADINDINSQITQLNADSQAAAQ
ncbi:MAG: hypothetical protein ABSB00_02175 [Minisyncoccia bacterium]|jgi:cytoskeletal protein RodZ